jgi:cytochrome c-type biogenesis protein CcmH
VVTIWVALTVLVPAGVAASQAADSAIRDSALDAQVQAVAATLRCPVCQNLSVFDSPSELALSMKQIVREQLAAGASPDDVRSYFVARYGEWILLRPEPKGFNLVVWLLPAIALAVGGFLVVMRARRWLRQGRVPPELEAAPLSDLQTRRERLRHGLQDLDAEAAAGRIATSDHDWLKQRDTAELDRVSEILKRRGRAEAGTSPAPARGAAPAAHLRPAVVWIAGFVVFLGAAALALRSATTPRAAGAPLTGLDVAPPEGGSESPANGPTDPRLAMLEERLRRDSTDHQALLEVGHAYLGMGRLDRAAALSFKAVQLRPRAPETAEAYAHLGMVLANQGEHEVAVQSIDEALLLHPDLPEALLFRGIVSYSLQRYPVAVEAWTRYLQVAPPEADTAHVRGLLETARRLQRP